MKKPPRNEPERQVRSVALAFSDCARVDGHAGSTGARGLCDVRCAPTSGTKADMPGGQDWAITGREQVRQIGPLFDHVVGAGEQGRWHVKTERLGGLEIDD